MGYATSSIKSDRNVHLSKVCFTEQLYLSMNNTFKKAGCDNIAIFLKSEKKILFLGRLKGVVNLQITLSLQMSLASETAK